MVFSKEIFCRQVKEKKKKEPEPPSEPEEENICLDWLGLEDSKREKNRIDNNSQHNNQHDAS